MSPRIYDVQQLMQIAEFYDDFMLIFKRFDPNDEENCDDPLYIDSVEIVIRHKDDYTIARIGMDDSPFVEFTEEDYGKTPKALTQDERDDSVAAVVAAYMEAHIRQEDTASGQKR